MATPASESNGSNVTNTPNNAAERRESVQEESKNEFSKPDAIMEPTTGAFVEQYLDAGGAPFNIMNLLTASYEGKAAMANMVCRDITDVCGNGTKSAMLEAVSRLIVGSFDAQKADEEFNKTSQLPEYVVLMLAHQAWRKVIYRLSERYPSSTMISAALQHIADQGHQAEMTSLNSAALHTHVFYTLLVECFEKISPANEENIEARMEELVGTVCRHEQTYLVAQYVLRNVQDRLGIKAVGLQRIEQKLETYMLDNYNRPLLPIHIQVLLSGMVAGGDDKIANAVTSIIQGAYAAPGDVVALYNAYYGALAGGKPLPPVHILRSEYVLKPILEQAFGCLWSTELQNQRPELVGKLIWLMAYASLCTGKLMDDKEKEQLQELVLQMKKVREELPFHPIQTHLYRAIPKVLEWISVPVLARVVLLWIQDVITFDSFTYYNMYFQSSEVPVPLLLLEEIAYRHPLLKPLVFAAYRGSFESRVPGFPPEKQLRLQKVIINRMAVLVQLDYAGPVLDYFGSVMDSVDKTVMVYFLYRTLVQFEGPYPTQFYAPMLEITEHALDGVKVAKEKEKECIREFLGAIDSEKARSLLGALSTETTTVTPLAVD
ncbi:hypothetical protein COEREDRAFT_89604 [Coemansia reversa NRRL 1564]|uniref:TH1 protein n=1 Tax=Coemansia reversa (strain ATCC 12441 / NRRL 1564) TaxID=763665 RepID=A0A2G5B341_COERN|nr:hypothetical protein COEREDRAFT_89604 [Coemansia reversa NRRL 1564]|eukprot:PIA13401.1 hypothetical protein COEREDRAFT_89604 [Coemansia reversa NRRL 1564]